MYWGNCRVMDAYVFYKTDLLKKNIYLLKGGWLGILKVPSVSSLIIFSPCLLTSVYHVLHM